MKKLFGRTDRETGGFLAMKWAQAHEVGAAFFELDIAAHHLHDVGIRPFGGPVVDPDDLAAVDVHDLLVEEVLAELDLVRPLLEGRDVGDRPDGHGHARPALPADITRVLVLIVAEEVRVGRGIVMKRFATQARGRSAKIEKFFSNVSIILEEISW